MKEQKRKKLLTSKGFRRFVALFAVFAMVISLFPNVARKVEAATQGYSVTINLLDYDKATLMDPEEPIQGPFVVIAVAKAYNKGASGNETWTTYAAKKIDSLSSKSTTIVFDKGEFRYDEWNDSPYNTDFKSNNYGTVDWGNGGYQGNYDISKGYHMEEVYLYSVAEGVDPSSVDVGSVWGTQISESDLKAKLDKDTPPSGYKYFAKNVGEGTTTIDLYKSDYKAAYELRVEFDGQGGDVSADDGYIAIVEVEHSSNYNTYAISDIVSPTSGSNTLSFPISKWLDSNGHEKTDEKFNGHEKARNIYIVKLNGERPSDSDLVKMQSSQVTKIPVDGNVGAYTYKAVEMDSEKDDTNHIETYYDKIVLKAIDFDTNYNFLTVLGDAVNYGVVSEEIHIAAHSETNFATNDYSGGANFDPDLSGDAEGNQVPGNFLLGNIQDGSTVLFGGETPATAYVMVPDGQSGRVNANACPDNVVVTETDATAIQGMVTGMIEHMQAISADMITKETIKPVMNGNCLNIDTTSYPDNAVIYVDGDNYLAAIGSNANGKEKQPSAPTQGVNIKKLPGQLIVFNFDSSDEVSISTIAVDWGEGYWTSNTKNGVYNDEDGLNVHADLVSRQVVWNLASCKKVNLDKSGGIYLLPRDDADINAGGTSCGWVVNAGHSELGEGGEFHFVYRGLSQNNVASLVLNKKVDNKVPTDEQVFDFTVEEYDFTNKTFVKRTESDGQGGEKDYLVQNNGTKITVKLTNLREGANIVRIKEVNAAGYKANDQEFYASFNVTVIMNGTVKVYIPSGITFYTDFDPATETLSGKLTNTPVFLNETTGGTFTVTKEVTGDTPAAASQFNVKLTAVDSTSANLSGEYAVEGITGQTTITFTDGVATFKISDGGEVTISGLPAGTQITVEETNLPDGYELKTTELTKTVVATGTPAKVQLVNEYTE